jgi:hypothetical protein
MVSIFAPNPRKLLSKQIKKSCNRRQRFTVGTCADKVKRRRVGLNGDKRDAGLVKAANGTRRQRNTNSSRYHRQYGLHPFGLVDNSWRKAGICAEQPKSVH